MAANDSAAASFLLIFASYFGSLIQAADRPITPDRSSCDHLRRTSGRKHLVTLLLSTAACTTQTSATIRGQQVEIPDADTGTSRHPLARPQPCSSG